MKTKSALAIFVTTVLVVSSWLPHLLTLHPSTSFGDEGIIAQLAYRIYMGEVPYRDFFFGITPGAGYWTLLFFKVFGSTFLALRLSALCIFIIILAATILILKKFEINSPFPYLISISFLSFFGGPYWFVASHHWMALAMSLISFYLLIPDKNQQPSGSKLVLSGLFAALAAFSLQHKGGLWILAATLLFIFYPRDLRKLYLKKFWAGILLFSIPVSAIFIYFCGIDTLLNQLIVFPATRYNLIEGHQGTILKDFLGSLKNTAPLWRLDSDFIGWVRTITYTSGLVGKLSLIILPLLGAVALIGLWFNKGQRKDHFYLLTLFFVTTYLGAFHRPSETTLAFSAISAVIILAYSYEYALKDTFGKHSLRFRNLFVTCWIGIFFLTAVGFCYLQFVPGKHITVTPAGVVKSLYADQAHALNGVVDYIKSNKKPQETIFCYSYLPIFYFLLQEENPTPYDVLLYPINTREQYEEAEWLLKENNSRWIVYDYSALWGFPFAEHIRSNYVFRAQFRNVAILERVN